MNEQIAAMALILIALVAVFFFAVWFGFRMGRYTVNQPLAPIVEKKQKPVTFEDPYYEAMHGAPAPSTPTVEERH